jgi:hypothetical protein
MDEVFGIFPTPFMRAPGTLGEPLVAGLVEHFTARATRDNNSSANLLHTEMLRPADSPLLREAAALITPKLVEFGVHLFGERLPWALKEMWVNVLDSGGRQAMHNHANSFQVRLKAPAQQCEFTNKSAAQQRSGRGWTPPLPPLRCRPRPM